MGESAFTVSAREKIRDDAPDLFTLTHVPTNCRVASFFDEGDARRVIGWLEGGDDGLDWQGVTPEVAKADDRYLIAFQGCARGAGCVPWFDGIWVSGPTYERLKDHPLVSCVAPVLAA